MTSQSPHAPPVQLHRNHGLFSDYYLNETLPQHSDWKELIEEAKPVMERLKRRAGRDCPLEHKEEAADAVS